ncbi:MAG TPA: hypothetical protein VFW07_12125 [Parafilimonas sp.]|nr:hypothetical protein [Parafilimonas sp.]
MQVFFSIFWWIYFYIFFSGFPLIYLLFHLIATKKNFNKTIVEKIYPLLSLSYVLVNSFFWILTLLTGRINFVFEKMATSVPAALVIAYSLTGLLFWLPALRRNNMLSFIHSLLLFLLPPLKMLFDKLMHRVVPHDYIITLLRIYTAGLLVYLITIGFVLLLKWITAHIFTLHHKV